MTSYYFLNSINVIMQIMYFHQFDVECYLYSTVFMMDNFIINHLAHHIVDYINFVSIAFPLILKLILFKNYLVVILPAGRFIKEILNIKFLLVAFKFIIAFVSSY